MIFVFVFFARLLTNIFMLCQEAKGFDDGKSYTFGTYKMMAENFSKEWFVLSAASSTKSTK